MWQASKIIKDNKWLPFRVDPLRGDIVRALSAPEGVADRLRLVCFAELQARDAFRYGAKRFSQLAPAHWLQAWEEFAIVEERHAQMLLNRMAELNVDPGERIVSCKLTLLCEAAQDPVNFLFLLSSAEERGMEAGALLGEQMKAVDPISAAVFAQIAKEEGEHVEMARLALGEFSRDELKQRAREINRQVVER